MLFSADMIEKELKMRLLWLILTGIFAIMNLVAAGHFFLEGRGFEIFAPNLCVAILNLFVCFCVL